MDTAGNVAIVPNTVYSGPSSRPSRVQRGPVHRRTPPSSTCSRRPRGDQRDSRLRLPADAGHPEKSTLDNVYTYAPWTGWQITYFPENFTNPASGPIFSQLYFRQAMQYLVDQNTFIKKAFFGNAYPTYGPVPVKPTSKFVDPFEKSNPYPTPVNSGRAARRPTAGR